MMNTLKDLTLKDLFKAIRKRKRLKRMMKLLDLTDVKLGRKFRDHLNYINERSLSFRKLLVFGIPTLAVLLLPILMIILLGIGSSGIPGLVGLCTFVFLMFYSIMNNKYDWWLVNDRGPIGKVVEELNDWQGSYKRNGITWEYENDRFTFDRLATLPFMDRIPLDKHAFENTDDWTNEELGQLLKLVIGCVNIHIQTECSSKDLIEKAFDEFISKTNAVKTMEAINGKVMSRRNERIRKGASRQHAMKKNKDNGVTTLVDEMRDRIVQEEPDSDNPDFLKIKDLKDRMDEKTIELRSLATKDDSRSVSE